MSINAKNNKDVQTNDADIDIDNLSFTSNIINIKEIHDDTVTNNNPIIEQNNDEVSEDGTVDISTYVISKENMISDFEKECERTTDKSIIYEYHFEKLNKIYNIFIVLSLLWGASTVLLGSIAYSSMANNTYINTDTIDITIIIVGFFGTITTGILTTFRYKDKIAEISKYIGRLDTTKDNLDVLIKRIRYTGISDQEYYKQLENARTTLTHSNSSTYNINSGDYYNYYKRLKTIKELKRNINHSINLDKEKKYNEYSRKHLELLKKRLELKTEIKDIHDKAKDTGIVDFSDSNVFTIDTLSTNEE